LEYNKKRQANIKTAEITFLWRVAGYSREDQMGNTNIREELNF
jgi:hypothetical protein